MRLSASRCTLYTTQNLWIPTQQKLSDVIVCLISANLSTKPPQSSLAERHTAHGAKETANYVVHFANANIIFMQLLDNISCVNVDMSMRVAAYFLSTLICQRVIVECPVLVDVPPVVL